MSSITFRLSKKEVFFDEDELSWCIHEELKETSNYKVLLEHWGKDAINKWLNNHSWMSKTDDEVFIKLGGTIFRTLKEELSDEGKYFIWALPDKVWGAKSLDRDMNDIFIFTPKYVDATEIQLVYGNEHDIDILNVDHPLHIFRLCADGAEDTYGVFKKEMTEKDIFKFFKSLPVNNLDKVLKEVNDEYYGNIVNNWDDFKLYTRSSKCGVYYIVDLDKREYSMLKINNGKGGIPDTIRKPFSDITSKIGNIDKYKTGA